jgi:anti-sigma factor RsiW
MNCEELSQLIPDLVDGTLPATTLAEAEAALAQCPDCQRELEFAKQIRTFLLEYQAQNGIMQLPIGFEARLLARVRAQHNSRELLDLSSKAFAEWLLELINLIGGLIYPISSPGATRPRASGT